MALRRSNSRASSFYMGVYSESRDTSSQRGKCLTHRILRVRGASRLRTKVERWDGTGRRWTPSLTNLAQWYLRSRFTSSWPSGLVYAIPDLPPLHSLDSVVEALNTTVIALRTHPPEGSGPGDSSIGDVRDETLAILDPSHRPNQPSTVPETNSTSTGTLLGLPPVPAASQTDSSSPPVHDLEIGVPLGPPTLLAPQVAASADPEFDPGPDHLSLVPNSPYPPFRNEHYETQPQIRRKRAVEDLKSRSVMPVPLQPRRNTAARDFKSQSAPLPLPLPLPLLEVSSPQPAPNCLQVGSPLAGPSLTRNPFNENSLKLRIPHGRSKAEHPESLQSGHFKSDFSPGPVTEMACLINAIDVVKEDFKPELDSLESDLGRFSCRFSFLDRSGHSGTGKDSSRVDEASLQAYVNRPLPHLPLAPHSSPSSHRTSSNLGMCNATLKALISAQDASNNPNLVQPCHVSPLRLSQRSEDVIQDFATFTQRSFFRPLSLSLQLGIPPLSDGTGSPPVPVELRNRRTDIPERGEAASRMKTKVEEKKRWGRVFDKGFRLEF
jgi:hypothetical protein